MGIRVDEDSLKEQLVKAGCEERAELPFQKAVLEGELPYTVGGGIGQSRICMFFLRKAHIGEVQASVCAQRQRLTTFICCKNKIDEKLPGKVIFCGSFLCNKKFIRIPYYTKGHILFM